ncbi:Uncharacterised protein [Tsukamurella paurometabola]|uniref:Uncharacterized protein n=1 Tax=Tsukamurella paurometabola TaxID=2061 RepID=A0A3P8LGU0_TSUPA|nr:Uncharacterised protein [Tsukamurella paurometabola]
MISPESARTVDCAYEGPTMTGRTVVDGAHPLVVDLAALR